MLKCSKNLVIITCFSSGFYRSKALKFTIVRLNTGIICKIVQNVNGYAGPTLGIEDIDGIFKGLYLRYKKQADSKSSGEVLRLM